MIVRYDPSYKDVALRLGRAIHEESRFSERFSYSEAKILRLLVNPDVFCGLSIVNGEAIGFFLGIVQQMWFSETKIGFDLGLYILPKYRGGTYAVRLIREFEKFCREKNCAEITLSSTAEISTELAERLYKKLGYKKSGFIARKDI